jgi:hypothetical protein
MFGEIIYSIIIGLCSGRSAESAVRQGQIQTNCQRETRRETLPAGGIKETNDLAEPELHMLVHHLAVKQGTNQLH